MKRHRSSCDIWRDRDKRAHKVAQQKATMLERHGVENPRHIEEAEERRKETCLERYGEENPFSRESSVFEKVQASLEGKRPVFFGEDNRFSDPEVQEKIRETMYQRYGAGNPQQVAEIRARTTATCEARYGGVLMASEKLAEKARATNLARYGDEVPQRTEGVKESIRATNMERYGVPWTCMDPEVRAKQLETHHERWGSHFFASEEGKAAILAAFQENWGVDHWMQAEGSWDRLVGIFRERYGVDHPLQLAEFLKKSRETSMKNWGTPHPMQNREYARQHLEKMDPRRGPNGLERTVQGLAPEGSLLFTGDFAFWRWLPTLDKHKNPDFIVPGPDSAKPKKGVTQVVEAFGDFWHSRMFTGKVPFAHEQELISAYAEVGIECLVIWESEVHAEPEGVRERLAAFLDQGSV
jgi:hypothetical protein